MKRLGMVGGALALMVTYSATSSLALDCVGTSLPDALKESARVLEATVTKVEGVASVYGGAVATVAVHRVWKGAVTPEATFYFNQSMEGAGLKVGERRILLAKLMAPFARASLGIPDDAPPAFYVGCLDAHEPVASITRHLGRARTVPNAQRR